jgi:DNA polymerase I
VVVSQFELKRHSEMLLFGIFDVFPHEDADFRLPAACTVGMTIFLDLEIQTGTLPESITLCYSTTDWVYFQNHQHFKFIMKKKKERLFLLDGMALAYRSYFAFIKNPLINSKGENTSAIFGFVNFLMKILNDEQPDHIAVVFDTIEPTFRHKMFKDYKATRQKMPEDMSATMDMLKDVVRAFNVPVVELPGYEADDVIGTLAKLAEQEGVESYLVTSDKDFLQLVSPLIKIYRPGKQGGDDEIVDEQGVVERFGVPPHQVIEILALTGDASDNVPGVPGIGPKTAEPLVSKYGTVENILSHVDEIPQKGLQEKLKNNKKLALLSKQLVTIKTDSPVEINFHELKALEKNAAQLAALYERLEFRTLARKLHEEYGELAKTTDGETAGAEANQISSVEHTYILIDSDEKYLEFISRLKKAKEFVFDTETTSKNALQSNVVGISFCFQAHRAYYLPLETEEDATGPSMFDSSQENRSAKHRKLFDRKTVARDLGSTFRNETVKKYAQNAKYDMLALSRIGIETFPISFDTMVASYILRSEGQHNLDAISLELLNYKMISFDQLTENGKKDIRSVPIEAVGQYSAEDADITYQLANILHDKLAVQGTLSLCQDIEFPLISVLADMERTGVKIDVSYLAGMSKDLERQLEKLVDDIYQFSGEQFNINSTQQLSTILFDKLKLSPVRKTKTGFSTDVSVLEALRNEHPIIERLLDYRQLSKLKSTYVDALPKLIHPETGRVHTSFNQTVAATGRLSSSDPNLQNIPIRSDIGREIRKAFIAGGKNMMVMSADYSQIELRVMAHIAGDEGLLKAFEEREDIHSSTASKIFGVSSNEVTREMRRKAKEVNFGIMYGIGPFGLASRLDITQSEAKEIISKYFERFPNVNRYIADTIAKARRNGFVETLRGRRRYLPDIHSKNANVRSNAERQAINMPIQGTAADMIKLAMISIYSQLRERQFRSSLILQVHDELVLEVHKDEENEVRTIVEEGMKNALPLRVPIEVEIGSGSTWLEAH